MDTGLYCMCVWKPIFFHFIEIFSHLRKYFIFFSFSSFYSNHQIQINCIISVIVAFVIARNKLSHKTLYLVYVCIRWYEATSFSMYCDTYLIDHLTDFSQRFFSFFFSFFLFVYSLFCRRMPPSISICHRQTNVNGFTLAHALHGHRI